MGASTPPTTNERILPKYDDTEQRLLVKIAATLTTGLGLAGVDFFSDAAAHAGDWWILHAVEDSVFTSVTYKTGFNTGSLAGKTIKAGDRIYGRFVSFTLASGSVEAYRASIG